MQRSQRRWIKQLSAFQSQPIPGIGGSSENTNGLIREYFPKGEDLTDISDEYIQSKADEINKQPRKCLGYRTPYEVYDSEASHLV